MTTITLNTERLVECREKLGISKIEAAKRVGLSQPAYLRYESGARKPSLQVVEKIADVLHTSSDYLLGVTDLDHMTVYNIKESDEPELFNIIEKCRTLDEKQMNRLLKYIDKLANTRE